MQIFTTNRALIAMKPKMSIITAACNNARFIADCGNSILSQSVQDIEWIVVDDASSDRTMRILSKFQKDKRVKIFQNTHRLGCGGSYARAIEQASAPICGIVDGDDVLAKDAIGIVLDIYTRNSNLDYIYTQHYWCNERLKIIRKGLSRMPKMKGGFLGDGLRHNFSHWRTFKTYLKDKTILFSTDIQYAVDKNMGYALEEVGQGGFLNKSLYYYRYYSANMSRTKAKQQKRCWKSIIKKFCEHRATNNITPLEIKAI